MRNVTPEMHRFKEASRHIWNLYLMPGEYVLDLALEESFLRIERELLRSIVLDGGDAADTYGDGPVARLKVRPRLPSTEVPIQFGTTAADGNTYWDSPKLVPVEELDQIEFIEFFDWNHFGCIDYGIVRALDQRTGRRVLIDNVNCGFWLSE